MEKNAKKLQGRKYLLILVNKFTEGFPNHRPNQGFTALAARMNNRWSVKKKKKKKMVQPHPRPINRNLWRLGSRAQYFSKLPKRVHCAAVLENYMVPSDLERKTGEMISSLYRCINIQGLAR